MKTVAAKKPNFGAFTFPKAEESPEEKKGPKVMSDYEI
jgi:hypothetical protein